MAADWRAQIRKNKRRTRMVIGVFLLIYTALGFLIDIVLNNPGTSEYLLDEYGRVMQGASTPISETITQLLQFNPPPYATMILLIIAAVSLLVTFKMYDKLMLLGTDSREINPHNRLTHEEQQLYNVVQEMKVAAGLRYMPKVYIIEADYMNAFATGYSEKSALVAITRGLMSRLDRAELQAVMAHELSHVRHLDIKLTLTASVLSNIMIIVIDILFKGMIFGGGRDRNNRLLAIIMILRFLLPIITVILLMYLSRTREYMADAGAVELTRDNAPLARALLKIHEDHARHQKEYQHYYTRSPHEEVRAASYIYDPRKAGITPGANLTSMFSSHPDLKSRLKAIGYKVKEPL